MIRVLVCKRTHHGDPDEAGCIGIRDCMGKVRDRDYDVVIGVGGMGAESRSIDIEEKVRWIAESALRSIRS